MCWCGVFFQGNQHQRELTDFIITNSCLRNKRYEIRVIRIPDSLKIDLDIVQARCSDVNMYETNGTNI